mmetsp:Transcript_8788/g.18874  ORF Transcript_8788/g.18874 Transcript_8788/m.18874 type:complete len:458 (-) Transcript_8788:101-1474(-)
MRSIAVGLAALVAMETVAAFHQSAGVDVHRSPRTKSMNHLHDVLHVGYAPAAPLSKGCVGIVGRRLSTGATTAATIGTWKRISRIGPILQAESSPSKYGRGSEIWPPTNEEPVRLGDSFPHGIIPPFASELLSQSGADDDSSTILVQDQTSSVQALQSIQPAPSLSDASSSSVSPSASIPSTRPNRGRKRKLVRGAVRRVLRKAATSEQRTASGDTSARGGPDAFWDAPVDRLPAVLAVVLAACGLVRPTDVMVVGGLTAYLTVLGLTSSSPRGDSDDGGRATMLPSLPPQGHVPTLVSNPLGTTLTNSGTYRSWLRIGAIMGLLLPLGAVSWYGLGPNKDLDAAAAVARPVFLICCQAVSEAASRRLLAPLPLRILVPVAYSAVRLGPLWDWALTPATLGVPGRLLAIFNYVYWATNLFAFLIPVALTRYMRAHFFCVEASEVQLRKGQEASAGYY